MAGITNFLARNKYLASNKAVKFFNSKKILALVIILSVIAFGGNYFLHNKRDNGVKDNIPGGSWFLAGVSITIDPGHGGVDPGAVSPNHTLEKDINLEIAKRLNVLFQQAGSKINILREDDRDFGNSSKLMLRKREDLAKRIQMAMESEADIYLSIHANSFPDPREQGAQVFYHPDSEKGKKLAESIQLSLNKVSAEKRSAKANQSYFILKNTDMLAVTIEVGFLSNPEEEKKLKQAQYQHKLAMAIFEGVGNYLLDANPVMDPKD